MLESALLAVLHALALGQPLPPELTQKRARFDPVLPAAVRPALEKAAQAELDPRRGPGNAAEILKAERTRIAGDDILERAIDLRIAALMLRTKFLQQLGQRPDEGYRRALSTFSRLDLTEPGLAEWIDRAIQNDPKAKTALGDKKARAIPVSVAVLGSGLDKEAIFAELKKSFASAGVHIVKPKPSEPSFVLRLGGAESRDEGGKATVRVILDLSEQDGGKNGWRQSMFRTTEAADMSRAVAAAVEWLIRIGGRELLFHWLETRGLEGVRFEEPDAHDHGHPAPPPKRPGGPPVR